MGCVSCRPIKPSQSFQRLWRLIYLAYPDVAFLLRGLQEPLVRGVYPSMYALQEIPKTSLVSSDGT